MEICTQEGEVMKPTAYLSSLKTVSYSCDLNVELELTVGNQWRTVGVVLKEAVGLFQTVARAAGELSKHWADMYYLLTLVPSPALKKVSSYSVTTTLKTNSRRTEKEAWCTTVSWLASNRCFRLHDIIRIPPDSLSLQIRTRTTSKRFTPCHESK